MLDLSRVDLDEIATALEDQTDYEHRWLINSETAEIVFWTAEGGIDGENPVDLDQLDLIAIDPLQSYVWYQDMADLAERTSDERARRRLSRTIQGRGAFRRFKDELHEEYPHLLPAWYAFRDARAKRRAVSWLVDNSLIDDDTAAAFLARNPDPGVPWRAHLPRIACARGRADLPPSERATASDTVTVRTPRPSRLPRLRTHGSWPSAACGSAHGGMS